MYVVHVYKCSFIWKLDEVRASKKTYPLTLPINSSMGMLKKYKFWRRYAKKTLSGSKIPLMGSLFWWEFYDVLRDFGEFC
jgi:hypothetical protein